MRTHLDHVDRLDDGRRDHARGAAVDERQCGGDEGAPHEVAAPRGTGGSSCRHGSDETEEMEDGETSSGQGRGGGEGNSGGRGGDRGEGGEGDRGGGERKREERGRGE